MTQSGNPHEPRIGDEEREEAVRALGEHYTRGRIDIHEFDERVTAATEARTAGQLHSLFADLPGPHPFVGMPPPHTTHPPHPAHFSHPAQAPYPAQAYGTPPMHPGTGNYPPLSPKSKTTAGLLQIFLPFGIGRFYTGHTGIAAGQLIAFTSGLVLCGVGAIPAVIWCIVDGISLLNSENTDSEGRQLGS
ncbi:DUF1707 domain-containing protein [Parasphingorhabdus pacifica]